jgi:TolB protein
MKKAIFIVLFLVLLVAPAGARVYIDINSPALRAVPTAVYDFRGEKEGRAVASIVRSDMQLSGIFEIVPRETYIESDLPAFNQSNWVPLGIDLVVKGAVLSEGDELIVTVYLYDVVDAKVVLRKQYRSKKRFIRPLGHSVANDIYKKITGQDGPFRTKIAFVGINKKGKRHIYLMDWDGKRLKNTGISGELLTSVHWSLDGKGIVYSAIKGKRWGIYLVNFRTGRERQLFRSKGTNIAGDFVPGRKSLLFSSSYRGSPDIYVYNLAEERQSRITWNSGIEVSPTASPDGRWIAFVSNMAGSPQIYKMRLDGTGLRRLSFTGGYNTSPDWSPRGDLIAFSGLVGGHHQIFVVNPDTAESKQLTDTGNNEDPTFSPDGRWIAFVSDRNSYKAIYIIRVDGGGLKRLTGRGIQAISPDWSPVNLF